MRVFKCLNHFQMFGLESLQTINLCNMLSFIVLCTHFMHRQENSKSLDFLFLGTWIFQLNDILLSFNGKDQPPNPFEITQSIYTYRLTHTCTHIHMCVYRYALIYLNICIFIHIYHVHMYERIYYSQGLTNLVMPTYQSA